MTFWLAAFWWFVGVISAMALQSIVLSVLRKARKGMRRALRNQSDGVGHIVVYQRLDEERILRIFNAGTLPYTSVVLTNTGARSANPNVPTIHRSVSVGPLAPLESRDVPWDDLGFTADLLGTSELDREAQDQWSGTPMRNVLSFRSTSTRIRLRRLWRPETVDPYPVFASQIFKEKPLQHQILYILSPHVLAGTAPPTQRDIQTLELDDAAAIRVLRSQLEATRGSLLDPNRGMYWALQLEIERNEGNELTKGKTA